MTTWLRRVIVGMLALYPAVMVVWATSAGPGISTDSVSYLAGARSLATEGRLVTFTGEPLTLFPPGFSVMLAALSKVGISESASVVLVNVTCVVLLVLGAYALARRVLTATSLALVSTAIVSLSAATVRGYSMAWSEPVFTLAVLAALILLTHLAVKRDVPWWSVAALIAVTWIALSFRYVGFILIPFGCVVLLWAAWPRGRAKAWGKAGSFAGVAALGLAAIAFRNLAAGSGALGERYPGTLTIEGAVRGTIELLGTYVAPADSTALSAPVGAVVAVVLLAGIWLAFVRRVTGLAVLGLFVGVYLAALWWSQSSTRLDAPTERLIAPILVPTVILVIFAVSALGSTLRRQLVSGGFLSEHAASRLLKGIGYLAVVIVLGVQLIHGVRFAQTAAREGLGYSSGVITGSPIEQALQELPKSAGFASNDPQRAYWTVGHGPAVDLPPIASEWPQLRIDSDLSRLISGVTAGSVDFVVYFTEARKAWTPRELEDAGLVLTEIDEFSDGTLYSVALAN